MQMDSFCRRSNEREARKRKARKADFEFAHFWYGYLFFKALSAKGRGEESKGVGFVRARALPYSLWDWMRQESETKEGEP
jgi:hypothetical protein